MKGSPPPPTVCIVVGFRLLVVLHEDGFLIDLNSHSSSDGGLICAGGSWKGERGWWDEGLTDFGDGHGGLEIGSGERF